MLKSLGPEILYLSVEDRDIDDIHLLEGKTTLRAGGKQHG